MKFRLVRDLVGEFWKLQAHQRCDGDGDDYCYCDLMMMMMMVVMMMMMVVMMMMMVVVVVVLVVWFHCRCEHPTCIQYAAIMVHPQSLTFSLKNDGWETILFSGYVKLTGSI